MNAGNAVSLVVDTVNANGKVLEDANKKRAIGAYAAKLIDGGATDDELRAWATHYGQRLASGARIRPSQAWEDVRNGQASPAPSPTALAGVPASRERQRDRRKEGYEWLAEAMTERQEAIAAQIHKMTQEGWKRRDIVDAILGPVSEADEVEA